MEERKQMGRPKGPGPRKVTTSVMLDPAVLDWARVQPGGISATVRNCLEQMKQKAERQGE